MFLLCLICFLCFLPHGLHAEECQPSILGKRATFHVPEGGALSLSCEVQHCEEAWTGNWMWKNSTDETFSTVQSSDRNQLTDETLSANTTRLVLRFITVARGDEGSYQCKVTWGQGNTDAGHLMYVNVTAAVPSQRNPLVRVFICVGAGLCLPVILVLVRCLRSKVKPQPPLRIQVTGVEDYRDEPHSPPQPPPRHPVPKTRSAASHTAPPPSQKTEVVYADISQDALRQQRTSREPVQSTVYSSVRFS